MITINTFQNWWRFFHRYSLAHREKNFDRIVFLSLKTLNCPSCQEDATTQYQILVNQKPILSPFEKLVRLHNYVNTKLKKPIYTSEQVMEEIKDILETSTSTSTNQPQINYGKLLEYYFTWLFSTSESCAWTSLMDLKEVSSLIADSFMRAIKSPTDPANRSIAPVMIQVNPRITSRPTVFLKTYDYYQNLNKALPHTGLALKSYHQVYPHANTKAARKPCLRCQQSKESRQRLLEARQKFRAKVAAANAGKQALSRPVSQPKPVPTPAKPAPPTPAKSAPAPAPALAPALAPVVKKVHPPRPPIPATPVKTTNTQPVTVPRPQQVHNPPTVTKAAPVTTSATSAASITRGEIHRNNPYLPELRALRRNQQTHFRIINHNKKTNKNKNANKNKTNSKKPNSKKVSNKKR